MACTRNPGIDPGSSLLNDKVYRNWMGNALMKTGDTAMAIITAAYGSAPTHAYFIGGSSGGRERLIVAGRWPAGWDGIVSLFPARSSVSPVLRGMAMNRAFASPGAWPNPATRPVLIEAAVETCDRLDGAADGVISMVKGKPLRCADGTDTGNTCLSDARPAPLANGDTAYPGANAFLSESGAPGSPLQPIVSMLAWAMPRPPFP